MGDISFMEYLNKANIFHDTLAPRNELLFNKFNLANFQIQVRQTLTDVTKPAIGRLARYFASLRPLLLRFCVVRRRLLIAALTTEASTLACQAAYLYHMMQPAALSHCRYRKRFFCGELPGKLLIFMRKVVPDWVKGGV